MAGFADGLTFNATKLWRQAWGNDGVDYDSGMYTVGGVGSAIVSAPIGGGVAMGGLRLVKAAVNNFDDAGRCATLATKLWQGGCFVAGTQVAVSQLPYSPSRASALWSETDWLDGVSQFAEQPNSSLQATASVKTLDTQQLSIPIEQVPLGARIPTKNPKPWERDDSLPEPDQASWAKLSITMYRTDGGIVDAELIRPRSWIKSVGIEAGKLLPMNIEELQVKGSALVTSIDDCPEIAGSSQPDASARDLGSVVTARFCTREVHTIARVEILGPEDSIETITGTTIHPVWSEDKQDWVPLGELSPGEHLRCLGEGAASDASYGLQSPASGLVLSVTIVNQAVPVYNIEVHGEHVYQVGELGLLVHNAGRCLVRFGQEAETAIQLADDAARAVANGFPHGVSTKLVERITGSDKLHKFAELAEVEAVFFVEQTGKKLIHYTVHLPHPVTDKVAALFNSVFKPKS
jgi:hypothetical protein